MALARPGWELGIQKLQPRPVYKLNLQDTVKLCLSFSRS